MRVLVPVAGLAFVVLIGRATPDGPKANFSTDDFLHPREVTVGTFENWRQEAAKKYPESVNSYTPIAYDRRTVWVVQVHLGYGNPYKKVAVYAPAKGGSSNGACSRTRTGRCHSPCRWTRRPGCSKSGREPTTAARATWYCPAT